jgi:hypothetical protein
MLWNCLQALFQKLTLSNTSPNAINDRSLSGINGYILQQSLQLLSLSTGLEIEITAVEDPSRELRCNRLSTKIDTTFADNRQSLGGYSSLSDSDHGVCFLFKVKYGASLVWAYTPDEAVSWIGFIAVFLSHSILTVVTNAS